MELIDRNEALNDFKKHYFDNSTVIRCAEIVLTAAPVIEAERIKHGHWIKHPVFDEYDKPIWNEYWFQCSCCNEPSSSYTKTKYCSECGAKMDEEVNNG
ncbi:MAG: hypothetical protein IJ828_00850, partial [Treponema sp.]|nr:hypothetical protein [Treponema sp.]